MGRGIKPSAPVTFCLCTVARHLEGRFAFLQGYYTVNLVLQSRKMQTTTSVLDMTQGMCETAARPGEVSGEQILQEKLGRDGSSLSCLRIDRSMSLLMALPFFCVNPGRILLSEHKGGGRSVTDQKQRTVKH